MNLQFLAICVATFILFSLAGFIIFGHYSQTVVLINWSCMAILALLIITAKPEIRIPALVGVLFSIVTYLILIATTTPVIQ